VFNFPRDSVANVVFIAVAICLVCSVLVSAAATLLRPAQQANKAYDQKENILRAAGMLPPGAAQDAQGRDVDELFQRVTTRVVDLDTGEYVDDIDAAKYTQVKAAKDPAQSRALSDDEDAATIKRREQLGLVYVVEGEQGLERVIIPVRGYGLWSTLYGYLALEGDVETVAGLGFYDQKETPGLGGEVDNPRWKALWPGVKVFGADGAPAVDLVKKRSPEGSPAAVHEVDALSGATITTRGVENLVRFWTGELGYGPYLKRLKAETT
jgi:Na+-transporting NADH:ubiquinone oxidoreductase subunit C